MTVAGHGSAAGVHQEAGEEAGPRGRARALNRPDQVGSRHLAVKERILARATHYRIKSDLDKWQDKVVGSRQEAGIGQF